MRRREFITGIGAAAGWPFAARAQQSRTLRRVGVLTPVAETDPEGRARIGALRQGLEKLNWIEERNYQLDYRWTTDDADQLRAAAAKLVQSAPDVIVVNSTVMLAALKKETQTLPVVFVQVPDPVAGGFVASLARPDGNITGFTNFEFALGGKWLTLLREISPRLTRLAVIQNPGDPASAEYTRAIRAAARSLGLQVSEDDARDDREIERTIATFAREPNGGVVVLPGVFTLVHQDEIVGSIARHRLPAVYPYRYFITGGGLISYGVETVDLYRRAASYVDRILKGEKPANLPVQAPVKFEMVINLKTAKVFGLEMPASVLALADEVIE
jgi:putative ABC transport system substrate-binding protein